MTPFFKRTFLFGLGLVVACVAMAPSVRAQDSRVWTVSEILAERLAPFTKTNPRYCQTRPFKPCVCASDVTTLTQYRPAVAECNGKAAIILSGKYTSVFSVVVRDRENRDRWPRTSINGCSAYERDVLGLNKCSAFKVQKIISVENDDGDAEVHCLGASGYGALFKNVVRITAKLADIPGSNKDPLVRWCLASSKRALN